MSFGRQNGIYRAVVAEALAEVERHSADLPVFDPWRATEDEVVDMAQYLIPVVPSCAVGLGEVVRSAAIISIPSESGRVLRPGEVRVPRPARVRGAPRSAQ